MNSRQEARGAQRDALRVIADEPERASRYDDQIARYLAGVALAETHRGLRNPPDASAQSPADSS